ncbi:fasciclin domain-containing protein [Dyadobacter sp. CY347]|uniref:fasciclin domain-containing protein n=1 Tax=Dyadobacter sp. CY347 TaxID=2909336 RepID=UPI00286E4C65|nr:fasciclin domain-containing protein [Dyadobacter sp. CY347]
MIDNESRLPNRWWRLRRSPSAYLSRRWPDRLCSTNAALRQLYTTTPKATLLAPANRALLTSVLLYHVVPGRVFSTDLPNVSGPVATANTSQSEGLRFIDLLNPAWPKAVTLTKTPWQNMCSGL